LAGTGKQESRNGKLLREGNFPKSGKIFRETGKIGKILKLKNVIFFQKFWAKKGTNLIFLYLKMFRNHQQSIYFQAT